MPHFILHHSWDSSHAYQGRQHRKRPNKVSTFLENAPAI